VGHAPRPRRLPTHDYCRGGLTTSLRFLLNVGCRRPSCWARLDSFRDQVVGLMRCRRDRGSEQGCRAARAATASPTHAVREGTRPAWASHRPPLSLPPRVLSPTNAHGTSTFPTQGNPATPTQIRHGQARPHSTGYLDREAAQLELASVAAQPILVGVRQPDAVSQRAGGSHETSRIHDVRVHADVRQPVQQALRRDRRGADQSVPRAGRSAALRRRSPRRGPGLQCRRRQPASGPTSVSPQPI
jgi:hypothetical protein